MTQAHFSSYTRRENRATILVLEGAIDVATADLAASALERFLADQGPAIVVDASRINFIDSRGIGTLLKAAKTASDAGGQLYLQNPTLPVTKILEACGLTAYFPPPPEPAPAPPKEAPGAREPAANGTARAAARATARRA